MGVLFWGTWKQHYVPISPFGEKVQFIQFARYIVYQNQLEALYQKHKELSACKRILISTSALFIISVHVYVITYIHIHQHECVHTHTPQYIHRESRKMPLYTHQIKEQYSYILTNFSFKLWTYILHICMYMYGVVCIPFIFVLLST